jgi:hypothetical protein
MTRQINIFKNAPASYLGFSRERFKFFLIGNVSAGSIMLCSAHTTLKLAVERGWYGNVSAVIQYTPNTVKRKD